jgi:hypothetical protein
MKKFLIALNIVIWSIVCFEAAHATEPAKKPVAAKKATKKAEAPKKEHPAYKHEKAEKKKVPLHDNSPMPTPPGK